MAELKLVIFDVDGTLVDSQADIVGAMVEAFESAGLPVPAREACLSVVGLSLPQLFAHLAPEQSSDAQHQLVEAYRAGYASRRSRMASGQSSPLYPGAREILENLASQDDVLLAIATGKSRRGLDHVIESHGLAGIFVSAQCADDHPSKPHPSMIEACLRDTGTFPDHAVMVGDTRFDVDMARAAGVSSIGVSWGYHAPDTLNADRLIRRFVDLPKAADELWSARS